MNNIAVDFLISKYSVLPLTSALYLSLRLEVVVEPWIAGLWSAVSNHIKSNKTKDTSNHILDLEFTQYNNSEANTGEDHSKIISALEHNMDEVKPDGSNIEKKDIDENKKDDISSFDSTISARESWNVPSKQLNGIGSKALVLMSFSSILMTHSNA